MSKRINVMLPDETLAVLDRLTTKGSRSRFVSRAVIHYAQSCAKQNLRDQLKAGYQANTQANLQVAMDWFPIEEEASQKTQRRTKDQE